MDIHNTEHYNVPDGSTWCVHYKINSKSAKTLEAASWMNMIYKHTHRTPTAVVPEQVLIHRGHSGSSESINNLVSFAQL